jgi:hypothetical protein
LTTIGLAALLALAGCSSSSKNDDGGGGDGITKDTTSNIPDGYSYWECQEEGKSCNAHDPCAIDPICKKSDDGKLICVPSSLQTCDDGLDCTQDVCKGMGLCESIPKTGMCALPVKIGGGPDPDAGVQPDSGSSADAGAGAGAGAGGTTEVRCFKKDDAHPEDPCLICDPDTDPKKWTAANGGACDDDNDCTKDDYCQAGVCKGVYYGNQCADQFGCTEDLCDGQGGCLGNQLKADWCLINGACYKDQATHPNGSCNICDVKTSQSQWTPISNTCMITNKCYNAQAKHPTGDCATCDPAKATDAWTTTGNGCLIDDKCYKAGDKDSIQCSTCDPSKSVTAWTPLSGLCKIDGKCYKAGDKHTGGCAECDVAASTTSWTVKGSFCLIENVCKNPKDQDSIQCSECDPTKDKYSWTPLTGKCKIAGKCYTDQATDTTGCLLCDYAKSSTSWTPVAGAASTKEDFESGNATGWTLTASDTKVVWSVATKRPGNGKYSLYYGDPVAGNFNTSGTSNSGSATMPAIQLTAAKKAGLTFSLYMDTESGTSYDQLKVFVGNTLVWEKNKTGTITMKQWQDVTIDLSSYAGQSVTIKFDFNTVDSVSNSTEGVYIDDITVFHNC